MNQAELFLGNRRMPECSNWCGWHLTVSCLAEDAEEQLGKAGGKRWSIFEVRQITRPCTRDFHLARRFITTLPCCSWLWPAIQLGQRERKRRGERCRMNSFSGVQAGPRRRSLLKSAEIVYLFERPQKELNP